VKKTAALAVLSVTTAAAVAFSSAVSFAAPPQVSSTAASVASVSGGLAPRALPRGSIAHYSEFWTWFGPRNWVAAYSAQGITIFGPKSQDILDYGSSMVFCAGATTLEGSVQAYFAAKRQDLKASRGLKKLRLKAGQITQLDPAKYNTNYFRQIVTYTGTSRGVKMRGEVWFDYAINDTLYCFSRNQSRTVPASRYAKSIKALRSMQGALAHLAPELSTGGPGS